MHLPPFPRPQLVAMSTSYGCRYSTNVYVRLPCLLVYSTAAIVAEDRGQKPNKQPRQNYSPQAEELFGNGISSRRPHPIYVAIIRALGH